MKHKVFILNNKLAQKIKLKHVTKLNKFLIRY